ncbi:MAG: PEP-CTERM sorting domain-containing protein [Alishewanella sp.]|nr:PEP-CTERM sorting domain-containing protein [Alishewanella sp.]
MKFVRLLAFAAMAAISTQASAGLIAAYDFDGNAANNTQSSVYNLATVGTADFSKQAYFSDGNSANYLNVTGPGGLTDWTLSLWLFTEQANQGQFKGIFSNLAGPNNANSWQIDSFDGDYRLISANGTNSTIGAVVANDWQHIVVQKFSGSNARLYFNGAFVQNIGYNPGGLQNFRVGINRATTESYTGYIDNIQIWNDSLLDAAAVGELYRTGPGTSSVSDTVAVPAPATLLLFGFGLIMAVRTRLGKK